MTVSAVRIESTIVEIIGIAAEPPRQGFSFDGFLFAFFLAKNRSKMPIAAIFGAGWVSCTTCWSFISKCFFYQRIGASFRKPLFLAVLSL
jgi:hypothetical protein